MKRIQLNTGKKGSATLGNLSRGEREIRRVLLKLGVTYYRESKYGDCRGGVKDTVLPFDFSVYIGDKLVALIEYQGVQHSVPTFTVEDWEHTRATDEAKRTYCKEQGIPLLEVQFHQYNKIKDTVTKFLQLSGVLKKHRIHMAEKVIATEGEQAV